MNFLSHFYYTQNEHNPYFTLGTVLPDLLRNYDNSWKVTPERTPDSFKQDPYMSSLLKGWELHLRIDLEFHSSPIFLEESSNLRKELVNVFKRLPIRPFFLAHVGYEILLDSLLIFNKLIDTNQFYRELAACDPKVIQDFLKKAGLSESVGFIKFLDSFIDSKYLNTYSESKNIVYAIDRIGRRVWKEKFNEDEIEGAILVFQESKEKLNHTFIEVFQEIETAING